MAVWVSLIVFTTLGATTVAQAYDNEVYYSSGYCWKVGGVYKGVSSDFATALQSCINATSYSWIDITCGGTLSSQITMGSGTGLNFHGNTVYSTTTGYQTFYATGKNYLSIINATFSGGSNWYLIRFTDCDNSWFYGLTIKNNTGMGIRQDSHRTTPYLDYWDTGLTITDCTFSNLGSHGIETYGIYDAYIENITCTDCGGCGICPNKMVNSYINNVYATRCCVDGGYAGLRLVNSCNNVDVGYVSAVGCGRGLVFGQAYNCTVDNVYIRDSVIGDDILITLESANCVVSAGTFNKTGQIHYTAGTGNYIGAVPIGARKIVNYSSGRALDVYGDSNGANVLIYDYWGGTNQKWNLAYLGSGYFSIRSAQSGARGLDVGWSPANGTNVMTWSYWGGDPQKWQIWPVSSEVYKVVPKLNTGQCMDAYGTSNSSNVGTWSYWGGSNQKWYIQNQ